MGLLDFPFRGQHMFENDAFIPLNKGCKFLWQLENIRKIEAQSTSINFKVIQKEKIKQIKLLGYL